MAQDEAYVLGTKFERIVLVAVYNSKDRSEEYDAGFELARLVATLGGKVVAKVSQRVEHPHRKYYVGEGKVTEISRLCDTEEADTVVLDAPLSPTQIASLEEKFGGLHVMDRRELILEIFARRAQTSEAKIQVELAYLDFVHPRMERAARGHREYRGGLRGSGATIVQKRTSVARKRRAHLRRQLEKIQQHQTQRTDSRAGLPTVALVGYTNAGKSSLLRALSGKSVYIDDLLFATLDTTTRRVFLPSGCNAVVSDTVGFIRALPHELVACFNSTLQEALSARVLVHVIDATAPDRDEQIRVVDETLDELGATAQPRVVALNKIDALPQEVLDDAIHTLSGAVPISAIKGTGLDVLRERIDWALEQSSIAQAAAAAEQPEA